MKDDLIRRKDALNFEITVEGPREAEEAILRTSQAIMDHIKSLPAVTREDMNVAEYWGQLAFKVRELLVAQDIVKVVRCMDCRHRPYKDKDGDVWAPSWDDMICPYLCEDSFYNWMPDDDFFCKRGERREDDNDQ